MERLRSSQVGFVYPPPLDNGFLLRTTTDDLLHDHNPRRKSSLIVTPCVSLVSPNGSFYGNKWLIHYFWTKDNDIGNQTSLDSVLSRPYLTFICTVSRTHWGNLTEMESGTPFTPTNRFVALTVRDLIYPFTQFR